MEIAGRVAYAVALTHQKTGPMPELPEVETVKAGIAPVMQGHVIARAEVNRPVIFYGAIVSAESATAARATYVRNSATRVTVYTWDASGVAADLPFTVDIK